MSARLALTLLVLGSVTAPAPSQVADSLPDAPLSWAAKDDIEGVHVRCVDAIDGSELAAASVEFAKPAPRAADGSLRVGKGVQWFEAHAEGYLMRRTKWRMKSDARGVLTVPLVPQLTVLRGRFPDAAGLTVQVADSETSNETWWPTAAPTDGQGNFELRVPGRPEQVELSVHCLGREVGSVDFESRRTIPNARDKSHQHRGIVVLEGRDVALEIPAGLLRMARVLEARRAGIASLGKLGPGLEAALEWLVLHQDADGRWNADGFMKHDTDGEPCDGPGDPLHDVGITALASLALLGTGNTPTAGPYRACVNNALRWLIAQMGDDGAAKTSSEATWLAQGWIYNHTLTTLALVEAYGFSGDEKLAAPAQKAVDYLLAHRNPYMCWRYEPRDNDNDVSVTVWATRALLAARDHGLKVDENVFQYVTTYLDEMTDPVSGKTGYTERGGMSARLEGDHRAHFPPRLQPAMTAAALLCRTRLGLPADDDLAKKQVNLVAALAPMWQRDDHSTLDFYSWCLSAYAMRHAANRRDFRRWWSAFRNAIAGNQRTDGNFHGSWDPVDAWGETGGRVYATAMLALALEAPFRDGRD